MFDQTQELLNTTFAIPLEVTSAESVVGVEFRRAAAVKKMINSLFKILKRGLF